MGRMSYWMNVSIDLMIEYDEKDHTGDEDGGKWMHIDDELHKDFNDRGRALAMFVEGRKTYEAMVPYWPDLLKDPNASDVEREWAEIYVSHPKILVSNSVTEASHNTRVIGGADAIEQLARLRDEVDGTLGVGGSNLATQLLEAGLLDELTLYTHPAVLGSGKPLFERVAQPLICDLIEEKAFPNGVVLHRYQLAGGRTE